MMMTAPLGTLSN